MVRWIKRSKAARNRCDIVGVIGVNVILPGLETSTQTKNTTRRGAVLFMMASGLGWAVIED